MLIFLKKKRKRLCLLPLKVSSLVCSTFVLIEKTLVLFQKRQNYLRVCLIWREKGIYLHETAWNCEALKWFGFPGRSSVSRASNEQLQRRSSTLSLIHFLIGNGVSASQSRIWTTTRCPEHYATTTTRTSCARCTESDTPTSSTSKVSCCSSDSAPALILSCWFPSIPGIAQALQPQTGGAGSDYLSPQTVNRLQQDFMQGGWSANYRSLIPTGLQVRNLALFRLYFIVSLFLI